MSKKATVSSPVKKADRAGRTVPVSAVQTSRAWWEVLPLLAVAAVLRLVWLDRAAFRADTIHFLSMAQQQLSFGEVWSRWLQLMGDSAQFPLSAALAMIPTHTFGLPLSGFSVRLSDAVFGVVAVGAAWLAGRMLGGRWFAWAFGLFVAVNPLHVQLSREAYFYSTLVAGGFLLLACAIRVVRFPRMNIPPAWKVAWVAGLFLSAYSHFTGWLLAGLTVGLVVACLFVHRSDRQARRSLFQLTGLAVLVAAPLTWLPWALPYSIQKMSNPASKAEAIRVMGEVKTPVLEMLGGYAGKMMWGTTSWAFALLGVGALALILFLITGARRRCLRWTSVLFVGCLGAYLVVMKSQGMYEAVRHVSFMFPLFALLIFHGMWSLPRLKYVRRFLPAGPRRVAALGLIAVVLLVQGPATWAALRITGNPTPYKDIQTWSNQHLAHGTPVLVDRWFEPWNELRMYPSTNVVFAFTRPNEPLDVFLQTHWRDGAERFLRDFPDAAYLEIAKSYAMEPGVGPWTWPRTYFKHHDVLANEAGLVLRHRGQAFREDFLAADTNRLVVEAFYNTREDVLQMARAEGRSVVAWPGSGWSFVKSGPTAFLPLQTADFMDWRLMERAAEIELHNLSAQPQQVRLVIHALAARGSKTVAGDLCGSHTFPPGRLEIWQTPVFELKPGQNDVLLRDAFGAAAPLLVQRWSVEPVTTP